MDKNTVRIIFTCKVKGEARENAIRINEELAKSFQKRSASIFPTYTPHITLYQAIFPQENEGLVYEEIEKLVAHSQSIALLPTKTNIFGRYVSVEFEKNKEIQNLHSTLIETINPLREGLIRAEYKKKFELYAPAVQDKITNYGYQHVFDGFSPHITLISLENESDAQKVAKEIVWDDSLTIEQIELVVAKEDSFELKQYDLQK